MSVPVQFEYATGLRRSPFTAVTLVGGWDAAGRPTAGAWTSRPMRRGTAVDGSDAFYADVAFDDAALGALLAWGVTVRRDGGEPEWGIPAEVADLGRTAQERTFTLGGAAQRETYRLTHHRARGARPLAAAAGPRPVRFTVWAPNARAVEVVFGGASGYIADDGTGADPGRAPLPMQRDAFGMWTALGDDFAAAAGSGYMYRVTSDDGNVVYRTDMYSLQQRGGGAFDPAGRPYDGDPSQLDGSPSCTVVVDPDAIGDEPEDDFWADEHDPSRPVPRRVEDLVIYELHVGALAPRTHAAGTLADALALLPYLERLGVNAVELLPMFEFNGSSSWGYGNSHLLAIEKSAGGRDALKRFVKAAHQHGIAVLMDVVYNHWTEDATRSAWQVDSTANERNIYYWYEAPQSRYPTPDGGYVDNVSSGWAPRYFDAHVRELFVSSAAMLVDEFHVDGLRVDQTTSMHAYNALHADGSQLGSANVFGRKTLRELCQTLKTIAPDCMLIAEDHSHWSEVTRPAAQGGIGFDAAWYADFYHHLIGDSDHGPSYARLLHAAARDHDGPLRMTAFAGALAATVAPCVVYVESHDEAGAGETERTIVAAVDGAPLVGPTRAAAEARVRFVAGMSMLSAGTPMFLMGEEVGAQQKYTYDHFSEHKEDLVALRDGDGAALFAFYAALIALRLDEPALRSRRLEVLHVHDANRVIAFRRAGDAGELLVVGSLNEHPFDAPDYRIDHPAIADGTWRERFNSDATAFGGDGIGNGATRRAAGGSLGVVVPAMGFVVLERA
ncbi:MAG: 1,4-alpha-glucan branching enzyme [Solirubrobacteraceae bacterium]|nr:1,4-alpha-glucan branching enzyme [Solirubrobacteraceae bacterium]